MGGVPGRTRFRRRRLSLRRLRIRLLLAAGMGPRQSLATLARRGGRVGGDANRCGGGSRASGLSSAVRIARLGEFTAEMG